MLMLVFCGAGFALEPNEILIIANSDIVGSVRIAHYYCVKRGVPSDNLLAIPLGTTLNDTISRDNYEKQLAGPIRKQLNSPEYLGRIKCLLTIYGVPFKVGPRRVLKGKQEELKELEKQKGQLKQELELLEQSETDNAPKKTKDINHKLIELQSEIDRIVGKQTNASVDSELSMVLFDDYELYRWQPNWLKNESLFWDFKSLMLSRLDGPGFKIAQSLVDKAVAAEKTGLNGTAYIDSRGIANDKKRYSLGYFDQSLRDLVVFVRLRTETAVELEQTGKLFEPGQCPRTAIYCGWYSLKKYVDAFDFVDGAIGYHISSLEAVDLRDPNSSQWCPAMLADGITATLGAVDEPYLGSFPEPRKFFTELFSGRCLVEAYYRTKPFNSWQMVLIGDPLYKPFRKP